MKRLLVFLTLLTLVLTAACTPAATEMPAATATQPPAVTQPPAATQTPAGEQMPTPVELPTQAAETQALPGGDATMLPYANSDFGLSFHYPVGWFGPEEYVSGNTLRVEVGTDVVYPYGTGLDERTYYLENSYAVVVQFTRNNNNDFWKDTYTTLEAMQDGQSTSTARSMLIRVRAVTIGGLKGFEYISTLSESAQTEAVYAREVLLVDEQSNLLTITGQPVNVVLQDGQAWRDVYRAVDEENRDAFQKIVDSIRVE